MAHKTVYRWFLTIVKICISRDEMRHAIKRHHYFERRKMQLLHHRRRNEFNLHHRKERNTATHLEEFM